MTPISTVTPRVHDVHVPPKLLPAAPLTLQPSQLVNGP